MRSRGFWTFWAVFSIAVLAFAFQNCESTSSSKQDNMVKTKISFYF